jgi:hypothetical protein
MQTLILSETLVLKPNIGPIAFKREATHTSNILAASLAEVWTCVWTICPCV